jgi:hypothetical protein
MAIEIGHRYPCTTQGELVNLQDATIEPGDIAECYFDSDHYISSIEAYEVSRKIVDLKEQYPDLVIHFWKVEGSRITVQFSAAPGGVSGRVSAIQLWAIVAFFALLIATILIITAAINGYIFPKQPAMGEAVIVAKDHDTNLAISGVQIFVDGSLVGTTGSSGSIHVRNLVVGTHNFEGGSVEGYQQPDLIQATINKDLITNVVIPYYPVGSPKPTTGWLIIYANLPEAQASIDGAPYLDLPYTVTNQPVGVYQIGFSSIDGYVTPSVQTATILGGEKTSITGTYVLWKNEEEWWQTIVKYALIGGGVIVGLAVLIPKLVGSLRGPKKEEQ